MLNLDEIRSFVWVARCGGFRRAADALGHTQSTVSHHVAQLEKRLGRPLFLRTTRSVRLTDDGERLLGDAQRLLEEEATLRERIAAPPVSGRVRIGASEEIADTRLPPVLARFAKLHPAVCMEVRVGTSAELIRACHEGELDVALVKRPSESGDGEVLWREDLVWMGAEQLRLDRRASVPVALYQQEESISRQATLAALRAARRDFHIAYTSYSLVGLRAAVAAGLAVAAMPASVLGPGLRRVDAELALPQLGALTYIALRHRRRAGDDAIERLYRMLCTIR
jgi:DNA-binding transcriptional LysR family regulator